MAADRGRQRWRRAIAPGVFVVVAASLCVEGCSSSAQRTGTAVAIEAKPPLSPAEALHAEVQKITATVSFAAGSAAVDASGARDLRRFAQELLPYPQALLLVQGFADANGTPAEDATLAEARAAAVKAYLGTQGIAGPRITVRTAAAGAAEAREKLDPRRAEVTVR